MNSKLFRALGVSAALLIPAGSAALFGVSTAGAALPTSSISAAFQFKVSTVTVGTATCPSQTLSNKVTCTTTGAQGKGKGSINDLKTGGTLLTRKTVLVLDTTVSFTVPVKNGTNVTVSCTIKLGHSVTLNETTATNHVYVGTSTLSHATVTPNTSPCSTTLTTIKTGKFTATITL